MVISSPNFPFKYDSIIEGTLELVTWVDPKDGISVSASIFPLVDNLLTMSLRIWELE